MLKRLKSREKLAVAGGATLLFLFLIYQFVILPVQDRSELLERLIPGKERDLQEIIRLKNEYEDLKKRGSKKASNISKKGGGAVTLSYLEDLAKKAGLKSSIQYMKPLGKVTSGNYLQNSMEIKFAKIYVDGLVGFLYDVENSKRPLKIMELNILTNKRDPSYIDVKIQIASFELI